MNYFIGDLHFGHVNCLSFDNRPFKTIADHDAVLIKNWNNVVSIEDDVYILGDISWYNTTKTLEILKLKRFILQTVFLQIQKVQRLNWLKSLEKMIRGYFNYESYY